MKVAQLYTYPIKSLRGTPITEALLTSNGFCYDRKFMLIRVLHDGAKGRSRHCYGHFENMHVAAFPELTLFLTDVTYPNETDDGKVIVTYKPPEGKGESRVLEIPLQPDTSGLEVLDVVMHKSPTQAYNMGSQYNDWFSSCLEFDTILAHIGENLRPVLGNLSPNVANGAASKAGGWLSSITTNIPFFGASDEEDPEGITFVDCAPLLIVSDASLKNVSARLPEGIEMDVTKFRPNIVVEGAEEEFDEDFWSEITMGQMKIILTANCVRCVSINIDYATGKAGTGEDGKVMKLLQKDRRVDRGMKWGPVFGRYGFPAKGSGGRRIAVGDEVTVTKRNVERTVFEWPGLSS